MPCRLYRVAPALVVASATLVAQQPVDRPTFRSNVQSIEVDVRVTDDKGNPIRGLTRYDFTLIEDGQPQPITSVQFVDLPIETRESRKADGAGPEPDITTNTAEGRIYVLVVGNNEEVPNLRLRLIARRFIEDAVGPNDRVAVMNLGGTMKSAQGFTTSRRLMFAAVDRMTVGGGDAGPPSPPGGAATMMFNMMEELCERLGVLDGRRKVVVWFNPPSVFQDTTGEMAGVARFAQRDAVRAASRNNVAFNLVSTAGLTTSLGLGSLEHKAGIRVLADDTGGDVIIDSNNFTDGYQRFVRDNSSYYLLGYTPAVDRRDGEFHRLTVRVNRRGATVRARPGYYAPEPDAETKPGLEVVAGLSEDAARAIRMPASAGSLGMDVFATPFKGPAGNASVLLGAQLRAADLVLASGSRIEMAYQAMTPEGKLSRGAFHVATLDFTPESRAVVEKAGLRIVDRIELPKGRHQVRFAVHQPDGKTGLVVADVDVPDYDKEPLLLSGVVLASEQTAGDRTLRGDAMMRTMLRSEPTARRRFSRRDTLTAFVEAYADAKTAAAGVRVRATLTTSRGRDVVTRVRPEIREPGPSSHVFRFPLEAVRPDDYVLTVSATAGQRTATRQLWLVVE